MLFNKTYYVHMSFGGMKGFIDQLFVLTNVLLLCSHAVLVYLK